MKSVIPPALFYFLSLTWGLPLTLFGAVISLALIITGHRPKKFGYCFCFSFGRGWGGLEGGIFFFRDLDSSKDVSYHEFGHALQNCYFGIFEPIIITIPSAIRYWFRRLQIVCLKKQPKHAYDDIWFEGQASRLGRNFFEMQNTETE